LVAILLAACSSAAPSPSDPLLATISVGARAGTPSIGAGAVWVPNTGDGTVSRIDPSTNRPVATVRIGDAAAFYHDVCEAYGSVHSFMVTTFHVRRCDLPSAVAAGPDSVWAAKNDTNEVVRIDPATNRIDARVAVGVIPFDLLVTPAAVWVSSYDDDALVRIDTRSAQLVTTIRMPGQGPTGLLEAGDALWVADSRGKSVSRIDPRTNKLTAVVPITCRSQCLGGPVPLPLAATGDQLWVRNEGDGSAARIDARTNSVVATIDIDSFYGRDGQDAMAVTPAGVWLSGIALQRIDPATNTVSRIRDQGGITLASGFGSLWLTDIAGHVLRIDPRLLPSA
jgi:DNA-binding beta-propeller fold protein YncE